MKEKEECWFVKENQQEEALHLKKSSMALDDGWILFEFFREVAIYTRPNDRTISNHFTYDMSFYLKSEDPIADFIKFDKKFHLLSMQGYDCFEDYQIQK